MPELAERKMMRNITVFMPLGLIRPHTKHIVSSLLGMLLAAFSLATCQAQTGSSSSPDKWTSPDGSARLQLYQAQQANEMARLTISHDGGPDVKIFVKELAAVRASLPRGPAANLFSILLSKLLAK